MREALRYNVAFNVGNCGQRLQNLMGEKGLTFKESTDKHLGILLNEIAHTHSNYWTMKIFIEDIAGVEDISVKAILSKVCLLYGLNKLLE